MTLSELLGAIAKNYDRKHGQQGAAARMLRRAGEVLDAYVPRGYLVKGSSGQSTLAFVPWIAIFDPDETVAATRGMYVVYLFAADMRSIYLTLLQGSEDLRKEIKGRALDNLAKQAAGIRQNLDLEIANEFDDRVKLLAPPAVQRPKYYEAGTILAKRYDVANLPDDDTLADDLLRLLHICDHAISCRRQLVLSGSELVATKEPYRPSVEIGEFKPKDGTDYEQVIKGRKIKKSRKHETLLWQYNDFLSERGFVTGSPHPRDFVAFRAGADWLVEAKVLQCGNGVRAARDALAQLVWYRHCYYSEPWTVRLLALFNEPVGKLCVEFLRASDIECVWPERGTWVGTPGAATAAMCAELSAGI